MPPKKKANPNTPKANKRTKPRPPRTSKSKTPVKRASSRKAAAAPAVPTCRTITSGFYGHLEVAFAHFNAALWGGILPDVLLTVGRNDLSFRGCYRAHGWIHNAGNATIDEINLNPLNFPRGAEAVLSTLVHEMAHLWRFKFGAGPVAVSHDPQWGAEMKRIGLYPSTTGEPGGGELGDRVTHYILDDGLFAAACADLLATGYRLDWWARPEPPPEPVTPPPPVDGKSKPTSTTGANLIVPQWITPLVAAITVLGTRFLRHPAWGHVMV